MTNRQRYADRAMVSYEALQRYLYRKDTRLYSETYPDDGGNPYTYLWPFSQALAATVGMRALPEVGARYAQDVEDRLTGLARYWNGRAKPPGYESYVRFPFGAGGDTFYDDNEWVGLELIRISQMTGEIGLVRRVRQLFDLVVSGWDTDRSHPAPGGVFWTRAAWNRDRNTVSTAPGAELALRLYAITGQEFVLDWGRRMYDWTHAYLLAPNGLYWDHLDLNGIIEKTQWSYNQGAMIGAGVLLYRATGERRYLDQAERTAAAALDAFGQRDRLFSQPAAFNAIFLANLRLLESENGKEYTGAIGRYAEDVWEAIRDPATGLFRFDRSGPITLLDQAAMTRIYACLVGE